nr:MAG TPA: hypothetical protein [Caudoviricetes sp.]
MEYQISFLRLSKFGYRCAKVGGNQSYQRPK